MGFEIFLFFSFSFSFRPHFKKLDPDVCVASSINYACLSKASFFLTITSLHNSLSIFFTDPARQRFNRS